MKALLSKTTLLLLWLLCCFVVLPIEHIFDAAVAKSGPKHVFFSAQMIFEKINMIRSATQRNTLRPCCFASTRLARYSDSLSIRSLPPSRILVRPKITNTRSPHPHKMATPPPPTTPHPVVNISVSYGWVSMNPKRSTTCSRIKYWIERHQISHTHLPAVYIYHTW